MTNTEAKALALVNGQVSLTLENIETLIAGVRALAKYRDAATEREEAFRQEVSDAVEAYADRDVHAPITYLGRFIIAKPDPLAEAIKETHDFDDYDFDIWADQLRAAIEKCGGKIIFNEEQN